jgi:hypothetical protein
MTGTVAPACATRLEQDERWADSAARRTSMRSLVTRSADEQSVELDAGPLEVGRQRGSIDGAVVRRHRARPTQPDATLPGRRLTARHSAIRIGRRRDDRADTTAQQRLHLSGTGRFR